MPASARKISTKIVETLAHFASFAVRWDYSILAMRSATWKSLKHRRIMPGDDQFGAGRHLLHAVLGAQVRISIESGGNGHVLIHVFVEVHIVAREHHLARLGLHAHILRLKGVLAAGVAAHSRNDLLIIAIHQPNPAVSVQFHEGQYIFRIDAAMGAPLLPGFSGVVGVFVFLDPDARFGKQVHYIGVVPVHVGDDHIGYVFGPASHPGPR